MRISLKFGYNGKDFSGYARQPGARTIEGEIIKALQKTTMITDEKDGRLQVASRTDKRVSACGNVIALDTDFRKSEILAALNAHLKEIWVYGLAQVPDDFNPRHAKERWYRFHVFDEDVDIKDIQEIVNLFVGRHDFFNFAKTDERDPVRTIDSISVIKEKNLITIDFKAQSFLWHMVRRIVKAVMDTTKGKLNLHDVKNALDTKKKMDFGIARPEPLILMDVRYDFEFGFDEMNLKRMKRNLENAILSHRINGLIYNQMLKISEK